jgi:hypothetical protein
MQTRMKALVTEDKKIGKNTVAETQMTTSTPIQCSHTYFREDCSGREDWHARRSDFIDRS